MKKLILFNLFVISYFYCSAQWKPYKIDDSVQVSLPKEYKRTDTLGQSIISAATQFGNIIIIKTPDAPNRTPDIEKKKHLDAFYKDYLQKIQKSSATDAVISDERDTTIKNLKYKEFTLQVDSGSGKQFRNFRIVHVNSATYTFEFLYQDIHKDYAVDDSTSFFNSIRIPPEAGIVSQFTNPKNTTGEPPTNSRMWLIVGIIAALIMSTIIIILLRKRKQH